MSDDDREFLQLLERLTLALEKLAHHGLRGGSDLGCARARVAELLYRARTAPVIETD